MKNRTYSWPEIRRHTTKKSGWIVIEGQVYDVTEYLAGHPGGPQLIIDWLGKDGSQAFATKGGFGSAHSGFAKNLLKDYLIGRVQAD